MSPAAGRPANGDARRVEGKNPAGGRGEIWRFFNSGGNEEKEGGEKKGRKKREERKGGKLRGVEEQPRA